MATKKDLIQRWQEEPGRTIADCITKTIAEYSAVLRPLEFKAYELTGLYRIRPEWLPPFSTDTIFELLIELPHRSEIANGRDLRGIESAAGLDGFDFAHTDFSYLQKHDHTFYHSCILEGAIFDGGRGRFQFFCPLHKVSLRKANFIGTQFTSGFFGVDCVDCDFSGAKMKKAHFHDGSDLRGSSFAGANMSWAILTRCDLRGCDFRGANLENAYIQESNIDKTTDFRGANLSNLHWDDRRDNKGNIFERASDWRRGTYDSTTVHD